MESFRHQPSEFLVDGIVDAGAYVGREAAAAVYQAFPLRGRQRWQGGVVDAMAD